MIKIVDNKKIDLTDDEFKQYNNICKSYDRQNFKGADLFKGLFDTDADGIIINLNPPAKYYTSFEVFLWLMKLMQHQHLRIMRAQQQAMVDETKKIVNQLIKEIQGAK